MIRTSGHARRSPATIRSTSGKHPAAASWSAVRCRAHSRCGPREDVQRQVAIVAVVAVEEAPFLFAVQRRVGHVEIEDHFLRRRGVRLDERVQQQLVDAIEVAGNLLVAVRSVGRALESVQGRLAGECLPAVALALALSAQQIALARQQRQQRIRAQLIVIVEVFVA